MDKKGKIALITTLLVIGILVVSMAIAKPGKGKPTRPGKGKPACSDGVDNDGDRLIDYPADPGCKKKGDKTETNPNVECDDGSDNDGDGAIDTNDGGCTGPTDNDETNCGDSVCEGGEVCDVCVVDCGTCGPPDSCSDTDGGFVIEIQGTVSGYLDGESYENTDYCVDSTTLKEYYCGGGNHAYSSNFDCTLNMTAVCSSGACV